MKRSVNITTRIALLAWLVSTATLAVFTLAIIPEQNRTFQENLRSKAYGTTVENLTGKTDADFNPAAAEVQHFREDDLAVIRSGQPKTIPEETLTGPG